MLKKFSLCAIACFSLSSAAFATETNLHQLFGLSATDLSISNDTDYPSTTALIMGGGTVCSTDLEKLAGIKGVTPAHSANVVPADKLQMLCGATGSCHAIIYLTQSGEPNCDKNGGIAIADVQFSAGSGLVSNTTLTDKFKLVKLNENAFTLSIQSAK